MRQLDRFRHPKVLAVVHSVEESSDTLAFATEPVNGSLANVFDYLEDRLPQGFIPKLKDYNLIEFEIKYGLLQVSAISLGPCSICLTVHFLCPRCGKGARLPEQAYT